MRDHSKHSGRGLGGLIIKALMLSAFVVGTSDAAHWPSRPNATRLYTNLAHVAWVANGHGPKILYYIFDPNCPYCHMLFNELEPLIGPDHLTVRAVPVGYLTPTSLLKAATILASSDPLRTIVRGEAGYVRRRGMAVPLTHPSHRVRTELHRNLNLLQSTIGYSIVPVLVYMGRNGKAQFVEGQPDANTLKSLIANIRSGRD